MERLGSWMVWSSPGSISVEVENGRRTLCLAGEIDAAVVERFRIDQGPQAVDVEAIDAGAVTFISVAGVELMLQWAEHSAARGRPPVLRQSSAWVDRLLALTKLDGAFVRPPAINGSA
jgi:anti-anti-sigma regulatory factor